MAGVLPDGTYQESADETFTQEDLMGIDNETEKDTVLPTKTWRICKRTRRIVEPIDDEMALEQYIVKALRTPRYKYRIYDGGYGNEIIDLIGSNISNDLIQVEVPRLVREALIYDDRILSVRVTDVSLINGDIYVDLEVESIYGNQYLTDKAVII